MVSSAVTLGVAVAIPEPWATQLQDYRRSVGDHTAGMIPTHITLVPPTPTTAAQLPEIEAHLAGIAAEGTSFPVHLRGTGTFRPVSAVVFVAVAEGISAIEQLAMRVRRGPLAQELAFPYHPHVTIAHDLPDAALDRAFDELADFECRFRVGEFHLYVHDDASGWRPTRDFTLQQPTQATQPTPPTQ